MSGTRLSANARRAQQWTHAEAEWHRQGHQANPARVHALFDFLDLGSLNSVGMAPMRMDARAHLRTSPWSRYRALLKIALALAFAT